MTISRNTRIEDIEFIETPLEEKKSKMFHSMFQGATYGDLLEAVDEHGGVDNLSGIGPKRAKILKDFITKNPPIEDVFSLASKVNSFTITTPNMLLVDKLEAATAGVDANLIEAAILQFKQGAVVIEP